MKGRSLVHTIVLCLAAAAPLSAARAEQLIQIPTADRVSAPTFEYLHRVDGEDEGYGTLLVPAGRAYELMFRYYNDLDHQHKIEGGAEFQLLPDGIVTPGVSLGLWDVTNSSPWERRGFLAITHSFRPGGILAIPRPLERLQVTLGTGTGRLSGVFAGARLDLPAHISLVTEYDARRFNAGLWWSPIKPLSLKGELQNGNPYVGGEFRLPF